MDDGNYRRPAWLERIGFLGLIGIYVAVVVACPIVGAILFFFPILPFYEWMGWEFSNLGPIATFIWGVIIDLFVVTPTFIILLIVKLAFYSARK